MRKTLWVITAICAVLGALITVIGISAANGAPQEAAAAAVGVAFTVIPYCLARAVSEFIVTIPVTETQLKTNPKNHSACSKCGENIINNSKVCRFCNTKFPHLSEPVRSHVELIGKMYVSINNPAEISEKLNVTGPKCATSNGKWTTEIVSDIIKNYI